MSHLALSTLEVVQAIFFLSNNTGPASNEDGPEPVRHFAFQGHGQFGTPRVIHGSGSVVLELSAVGFGRGRSG